MDASTRIATGLVSSNSELVSNDNRTMNFPLLIRRNVRIKLLRRPAYLLFRDQISASLSVLRSVLIGPVAPSPPHTEWCKLDADLGVFLFWVVSIFTHSGKIRAQ
jgi:hypothetical protein